MIPSENQKKLLRSCPVCQNDSGEVLHNQSFVLPESCFLTKAYDVVACAKCGFVFADTPSLQEDYDRYYQDMSKYEDTTTASGGGHTEYDARRLQRTASDIACLLPGKDAKILDIGCANGGLLLALRQLGYSDLTGLDPSPSCVATVKEQGINAFCGGLFSKGLINLQYDCILLTHVLEHVRDVQGAMKNILPWLREGGLIYVEVPDASRYNHFFIVPFYYFDSEHINHFDENSLRNLFSRFPGEVVKAEQKELPVSAANMYPAVYVFFKKNSEDANERGIVPDQKIKGSILESIAQSSAAGMNAKLEDIAKSGEQIMVWGAGQFTQRLLDTTPLARCNIAGFIDNDSKKHALTLNSKIIFPPQVLKDFTGTVVICSALHSGEILSQMKAAGFKNNVFVLK